MFRVSTAAGLSHTTVTIDGQLVGDCVDIVEKCCDQALSAGTAVLLFLRDVSILDLSARAMLSRVSRKGVRLLGAGVYTSYLADEIGQAGAERKS